jgi:hypothetical protein
MDEWECVEESAAKKTGSWQPVRGGKGVTCRAERSETSAVSLENK